MGPENNKTVVIGLGNVLLKDDGLAIHAIRRLRQRYRFPREIDIIEGATSAMDLFRSIEETDQIIVVDAVRTGAAPGTLVRIPNEEIPNWFGARLSPHQMGIMELLALLTALDRAPKCVTVLGIEGVAFGQGTGLSRVVSDRLDQLVDMIVDELRNLGHKPDKT